jgi:hypothetical protein
MENKNASDHSVRGAAFIHRADERYIVVVVSALENTAGR